MPIAIKPRRNVRTARTAHTTQTLDTAHTARTARVGLRSSPAQVEVLRRAADVARKSLTDFILDSACLAAEQTLLDQRLFMVDNQSYENFLAMLDRPATTNAGLKDLFAQSDPWDLPR
jgi:uncharacterized protein (DUF1778 family)